MSPRSPNHVPSPRSPLAVSTSPSMRRSVEKKKPTEKGVPMGDMQFYNIFPPASPSSPKPFHLIRNTLLPTQEETSPKSPLIRSQEVPQANMNFRYNTKTAIKKKNKKERNVFSIHKGSHIFSEAYSPIDHTPQTSLDSNYQYLRDIDRVEIQNVSDTPQDLPYSTLTEPPQQEAKSPRQVHNIAKLSMGQTEEYNIGPLLGSVIGQFPIPRASPKKESMMERQRRVDSQKAKNKYISSIENCFKATPTTPMSRHQARPPSGRPSSSRRPQSAKRVSSTIPKSPFSR
eukprot:CAMPEP_0117421322 /NCGR_PEP_ID=MMETSP0758-20121206/2449_1 /TAXON_ID=63605 /ORGANISM="Percolomonas cosmopolitus, Strain AE-1 (ATCC 50343)" /LENGTH=286 /DNA_ID=CAMNT_0005203401 /DNA_START=18 /DNA_END=875 /DNA_ORIENTATION=-